MIFNNKIRIILNLVLISSILFAMPWTLVAESEYEPLQNQSIQTELIVSGWKKTWPNLVMYNFDSYHILIDPKLVVENFDAMRGQSDDLRGFGKILITAEAEPLTILRGSQEPGHRRVELRNSNGSAFEFGSYICVPANGYLYSIDRPSFTRISIVRKFEYISNDFIEVPQPFYHCSIKTTASANINIYSSQDLKVKVATILSGADLTVIGFWARSEGVYLSDDFCFLLKTHGGLIGWHKAFVVGNIGPSTLYSLPIMFSD